MESTFPLVTLCLPRVCDARCLHGIGSQLGMLFPWLPPRTLSSPAASLITLRSSIVDGGKSTPLYDYDCSRSEMGRKCAAAIGAHSTSRCACLSQHCLSATQLLAGQSSECVLECRAPAAASDICPNYDDQQIYCEYYATYQCVSAAAACDASKLSSSTRCEAICALKVKGKGEADDQLDAFLQCLSSCEPSSSRDREARAAFLETW